MTIMSNENNDEKKAFSLILPASSPSAALLENQENKREFFRQFFDDFTTVNGVVKNYSLIPKEERLRKLFGVPIPRQEIRQKLQAELAKMKENKNLLIYAVEYVAFWVKYYLIFLPNETFTCFIAQFVIPNAKRSAENGLTEDSLRYAIMRDMEAFGKKCLTNALSADGMAELEAREKAFGLAKRIFIMLAYQWHTTGLAGADAYSSEDVVDMVLEFMDNYLKLDYWNDMFLAPLFARFVGEKLMTPNPVAPLLS